MRDGAGCEAPGGGRGGAARPTRVGLTWGGTTTPAGAFVFVGSSTLSKMCVASSSSSQSTSTPAVDGPDEPLTAMGDGAGGGGGVSASADGVGALTFAAGATTGG